ncbi:MAG: hypothetical protein IPM12_06400 [Flavobacteriales bacterium]|nr:hypothetical protein [Flavobacteriales bacterium]
MTLLQLAFIGFAVVGANQLVLMESDGVARRGTLMKVNLPLVQEGSLAKFDRNSEYIIIGTSGIVNCDPCIQLTDFFADLSDIGPFFRSSRERRDDSPRPKQTAIIYADRDTPMEVITAVKQELRLAGQLRVCYAVTPINW